MAAMKAVSPKLSRQTSVWNAGVGFHASDSLGARLFGLVCGYLALLGGGFFFASVFLMGLGLAYLAAMGYLAGRYWFAVPLRGIALAGTFCAAGLVAAAVG